MSKRPFAKIKRIDKKENVESNEPNIEDTKEEQQTISKNNIRPPKFSLEKKKIQISNDETGDKKEVPTEPEIKASLGSKPILFRGKREGGKLIINNNRNTASNQPADQINGEAPKPTPLVIKKRIGLAPKIKDTENIVIQEEESVPKLDFEQTNNFEESRNVNVEQSNNFRRKPDLKLKRFLNKKPASERVDDVQESEQFNKPKQEEYRIQTSIPVPLQYRQINIEPSKVGLSEGKIEKQRKRTHDLKNLLNLQIDLYEQTLSISSVTSYEIYINKIKSAFLKNSNDQAFDDKMSNSCQTLSFEYNDFMNQCPQDYTLDINSIEKIDDNQMFNQFVLRVASVVEELIKPTASITEPPIFLLAFRPTFKAFVKCPYPIFIYRSEQYNLDLIVMGEKLYITEGEIQSVLMIDKNIIAGLKNGYIVLWNGQNSKSSRLYKQINQFTQTTNFQLPSFCTHDLEKLSAYSSEFSIVSLIHEERSEFSSLDGTGKIVRWVIENTANNSQIIRTLSIVELRNLTQHWALQAYCIKRRNQAYIMILYSYYISTSIGLIFLQNQQVKQKLDTEGMQILTFEVPKKTPLVYIVCENNTLMIFNELYSHKLFEMSLQIGTAAIRQIILPDLEHDNRQIIILFVAYLADSLGRIFEVRLLENKVEYLQLLSEQEQDDRKDKNVIFKGVNRIGESLETIKLMKDLKITTASRHMQVNMQKTIPNLKSIIEKNREIMTLLEYENVVIY